ncbi:MAG: hypothetical protein F6K53_39730 [Moorea sp. SIO4A1]|uniref:hypothetical protein n=2 Tax=unclassified Moorena TaxID=2683338 RepID=UPI001418A038|nr:hypothetical protein [Moorena sp. SIO4A1]NEO46548.1 hypothetical protein [Moorena sp. SIO4A3]NEQ63156.1 hypothetical protein [Moorena sp. SIO4A1]
MKKFGILFFLSLFAFLSQVSPAEAQKRRNTNVTIEAEVVTGWNRLFGKPRYRWDFLSAPLNLAGATTMGIYNPNGQEPLPLTASTRKDAVLASIVDPFLETIFPVFDLETTDPEAVNVPLRQIDTWVSGDLSVRTPLPFQLDAPVVSRSQSNPESPNPITVADWFKASGQMQINCDSRGNNRVRVRLNNLIPNRVYTVWAMWYTAEGNIFPQPFGGVPNAYITNSRGNAVFSRQLNFCPPEAAKKGIDGNRLLSIITHLHSDHILYGAVPVPLVAGRPPGTVLHMQLEWNFPGVGTRLIKKP